MEFSNQLCHRCHTKIPTMTCTCQHLALLLCDECVPKHISEQPLPQHSISIRRQSTAQDLEKLRAIEVKQKQEVEKRIRDMQGMVTNLVKSTVDAFLLEVNQHHLKFDQFAQDCLNRDVSPSFFRSQSLYSVSQDNEQLGALQQAVKGLFKLNLQMPGIGTASYFPVLRPNQVEIVQLSDLTIRTISISASTQINAHSVYTLLPDERIFTCGGTWHSASYLVNTWDGGVKTLRSMAQARAYHGMVQLGGQVVVFGGAAAEGSPLASCERMTLGTELWTPAGNMTFPRFGINPCEVSGQIYIAGGGSNTMEIFNPATSQFIAASVNLPGSKWTMCLPWENKVIVLGSGKILTFSTEGGLQQISSVDHTFQSWYSPITPLMTPSFTYFYHPYQSTKELIKFSLSSVQSTKLASFKF